MLWMFIWSMLVDNNQRLRNLIQRWLVGCVNHFKCGNATDSAWINLHSFFPRFFFWVCINSYWGSFIVPEKEYLLPQVIFWRIFIHCSETSEWSMLCFFVVDEVLLPYLEQCSCFRDLLVFNKGYLNIW